MRTFEEIAPRDRAAWRAWLAAHHTRSESVWLVNFKASSGKQIYSMNEAVEEALCFGWIDSLPRKVDAERTKLLFSPRKPGSAWSALNIKRVEALIAAGLMTPAGQAKIDAARADGSWDKLASVNALEIPPDLASALRAHPGADVAFAGFPPSIKRGVLEWLQSAKTAATRRNRVFDIAEKAARGERANQWRQSKADQAG